MMAGMPGGTQLAWGVSAFSPLACAALKAASFCAYSGVNAGCSAMPGPGRVRTPNVTSQTPLRSGVDLGVSAAAAAACAAVASIGTTSVATAVITQVMRLTDFFKLAPLRVSQCNRTRGSRGNPFAGEGPILGEAGPAT